MSTAPTLPAADDGSVDDDRRVTGDVVELDQIASLSFSGSDLPRADLSALRAYSEAHLDDSAGVFLAGTSAWIGFVRDHGVHLAAVRHLVSQPDRVGAFRARHPLARLRALRNRLAEDSPLLLEAGIEVSLVAVREPDNRVNLGVASPLGREQRALLAAKYPQDQLLVVEGVVVRPA